MTLLQQHQPARQLADEPSTRLQGIDAKTEWLFSKFRDPACPQSQRQRAREQVVGLYLPWASSLARRFGSRGEPLDDLVQVASYALVKAVDRFDPTRGVPFTAYATPTMLGELKRHFRDHGWDVRVPRRLQEGHLALSKLDPSSLSTCSETLRRPSWHSGYRSTSRTSAISSRPAPLTPATR